MKSMTNEIHLQKDFVSPLREVALFPSHSTLEWECGNYAKPNMRADAHCKLGDLKRLLP